MQLTRTPHRRTVRAQYMSVRVKICGLSNFEDASVAVDAGADALGFIFFEGSPRYVAPSSASAITRKLPPFISKVGVFVDTPTHTIQEIVSIAGLDTVQLHGNETPEFCAELRKTSLKIVKAFRVKDESILEKAIAKYQADAFLLDSYVAGQLGGTGEVFNWNLAVKAKAFGIPIILAGGLTAENVRSAITEVQPFAVDVSSGVEQNPRQKDHDKIRRFIRNAKQGV